MKFVWIFSGILFLQFTHSQLLDPSNLTTIPPDITESLNSSDQSNISDFNWNLTDFDGNSTNFHLGFDANLFDALKWIYFRLTPNCTEDDCKLPYCFCNRGQMPGNLPKGTLPQMVLFSYTGTVDSEVQQKLKKIFPDKLINPNGCPIAVTVFVEGDNSQGCNIHQLYMRGHEIATSGKNHTLPLPDWKASNWSSVYQVHRQNMTKLSYLDMKHVQGMRARNLLLNLDTQFTMQETDHFEYDSSLIIQQPEDLSAIRTDVWPFTLDVPLLKQNLTCFNERLNCPVGPHPFLWEVPVNPLSNHPYDPCIYLEDCSSNTPEEYFNQLKDNFLMYYEKHRSPFQVHLDRKSLFDDDLVKGLKKFLDYLIRKPDTWMVTYQEALQWMRHPVPNSDAGGLWKCTEKRMYNLQCSKFNQTETVPPFLDVIDTSKLWIYQTVFLFFAYLATVRYDRVMRKKKK